MGRGRLVRKSGPAATLTEDIISDLDSNQDAKKLQKIANYDHMSRFCALEGWNGGAVGDRGGGGGTKDLTSSLEAQGAAIVSY